MIALAAALVVALLCLCLVLFVFLGLGRTVEVQAPPSFRTLTGLSAARIQELDLIFLASGDYHILRARPELKPLGSKLWRDRRRIALIWLTELRNDVRVLWRFRRFLVRNGLRVRFRDEAGILLAVILLLSSLTLARTTVFLSGPFLFTGVIRATGVATERLSQRCGRLLSSLPPEKRLGLEQKWTQEVLALAGL